MFVPHSFYFLNLILAQQYLQQNSQATPVWQVTYLCLRPQYQKSAATHFASSWFCSFIKFWELIIGAWNLLEQNLEKSHMEHTNDSLERSLSGLFDQHFA